VNFNFVKKKTNNQKKTKQNKTNKKQMELTNILEGIMGIKCHAMFLFSYKMLINILSQSK